MKTVLAIALTILGLNLLALALELLFSNPITGTITFFSTFGAGIWLLWITIKGWNK